MVVKGKGGWGGGIGERGKRELDPDCTYSYRHS